MNTLERDAGLNQLSLEAGTYLNTRSSTSIIANTPIDQLTTSVNEALLFGHSVDEERIRLVQQKLAEARAYKTVGISYGLARMEAEHAETDELFDAKSFSNILCLYGINNVPSKLRIDANDEENVLNKHRAPITYLIEEYKEAILEEGKINLDLVKNEYERLVSVALQASQARDIIKDRKRLARPRRVLASLLGALTITVGAYGLDLGVSSIPGIKGSKLEYAVKKIDDINSSYSEIAFYLAFGAIIGHMMTAGESQNRIARERAQKKIKNVYRVD